MIVYHTYNNRGASFFVIPKLYQNILTNIVERVIL